MIGPAAIRLLSNISANTKPYAKQLSTVNQGDNGGLIDEKTDGQKHLDTLPS
jgi:hypothetical protein